MSTLLLVLSLIILGVPFAQLQNSSDVDECAAQINPCKNGGTCENTIQSFTCNCSYGFSGDLCETIPTHRDTGRGSPCSIPFIYQGTSFNTCIILDSNVYKYWCSTTPNFDSDLQWGYCYDVDECAGNVSLCQNGGYCVNLFTTFRCDCGPGYAGQFCEIDISARCAANDNPCKFEGTCVGSGGSYMCNCKHGYSGLLCDKDCEQTRVYCSDLPSQCASAGPQRNCGGNCLKQPVNQWGWTGEDCLKGNLALNKRATQSTDFAIVSLAHYAVDGITDGTRNFAHTQFMPNSWWMVDLGNLSAVTNVLVYNRNDESSVRLSYFNIRVGNCSNIDSHSLCKYFDDTVPEGTFSNITCTQPMTARYVSIQLTPNSTVYGSAGGGGLTLVEVAVIGQVYCIKDDGECEADDNPCKFHTTCTKTNRSHTCNCTEGYTGVYCEAELTGCETEPCQNGGTCTGRQNRYLCHCIDGFFGVVCENANSGMSTTSSQGAVDSNLYQSRKVMTTIAVSLLSVMLIMAAIKVFLCWYVDELNIFGRAVGAQKKSRQTNKQSSFVLSSRLSEHDHISNDILPPAKEAEAEQFTATMKQMILMSLANKVDADSPESSGTPMSAGSDKTELSFESDHSYTSFERVKKVKECRNSASTPSLTSVKSNNSKSFLKSKNKNANALLVDNTLKSEDVTNYRCINNGNTFVLAKNTDNPSDGGSSALVNNNFNKISYLYTDKYRTLTNINSNYGVNDVILFNSNKGFSVNPGRFRRLVSGFETNPIERQFSRYYSNKDIPASNLLKGNDNARNSTNSNSGFVDGESKASSNYSQLHKVRVGPVVCTVNGGGQESTKSQSKNQCSNLAHLQNIQSNITGKQFGKFVIANSEGTKGTDVDYIHTDLHNVDRHLTT